MLGFRTRFKTPYGRKTRSRVNRQGIRATPDERKQMDTPAPVRFASPDILGAMLRRVRMHLTTAGLLTLGLLMTAGVPTRAQQLVGEDTVKVSDHVWAIMGFPNVGIVVGSKATLVVD